MEVAVVPAIGFGVDGRENSGRFQLFMKLTHSSYNRLKRLKQFSTEARQSQSIISLTAKHIALTILISASDPRALSSFDKTGLGRLVRSGFFKGEGVFACTIQYQATKART